MAPSPYTAAWDVPGTFQTELEPICPSCSEPMIHVPGYFHCPQCHFALCENYDSRDNGETLRAGNGVAG